MCSCGIDFGTSNSSIAIENRGIINLVPVEGEQVTIPSAIFYEQNTNHPFYGREAIARYLDRNEGRFMRSLKRVLGSSVMKHGTVVNGKLMKFDWIIGSFLKNIKRKADSTVQKEIENVVMGRPVHFVDNDNIADNRAQEELKAIAQSIGFKNIEFQFEPIAAAFAHEVKITGEKLAIVVDIGGGTSDFTIIKVSSQYVYKKDRTSDILANTGVRVGGNDFDKELSLAAIMPEFGYKSTYGEKRLEVPLKPFHDLAEWSKVNFLYTPKIISQMRQLLNQSHDRVKFGRLLNVLEQETGHTLLSKAEDTKIALTLNSEYKANFDFLNNDFSIPIQRQLFEDAIHTDLRKISDAATECLQLAGVKATDINIVILTGGSTEVPAIQAEFKKLFPNASIADENKLSSVGLGLAYDSLNKFGSKA